MRTACRRRRVLELQINEFGRFSAYHHILVLRPDVVLTQPLRIHHICGTSPGINIISGVEERGMVSDECLDATPTPHPACRAHPSASSA